MAVTGFIGGRGPIKIENVDTFAAQGTTTLTVNDLPLGAKRRDRETFISLSVQTAGGASFVSASLGGQALSVVEHAEDSPPLGGGVTNSLILRLNTGEGSALKDATAANLVVNITGSSSLDFGVAGSIFRVTGGGRPITIGDTNVSEGLGTRSAGIDVFARGGTIACFTCVQSQGNAVVWTNADEYADFDFSHPIGIPTPLPGRHSSATRHDAAASTLTITASHPVGGRAALALASIY